ncbi:hypothetical protein BJV82DRAFT_604334 [Fennellomyces sp. T-0311]|nr:hypothetical protein BJV82DRAFT_604334 [Fennellomyces sp. T-0311]
MDTPILPSVPYISLLSALSGLIQDLNTAIEGRDYRQTVRVATDVIYQVRQSDLLLALLDVRAHAHSMQGQLYLAIGDSEEMIRYAPDSAAGYLRKGGLLSMYGQQDQAIKSYGIGLDSVPRETPDVDRLVIAMSTAMLLGEKKIDFITALPFEVISEILAPLSESAKIECLMVSKAWRERTLDCATAWNQLIVDENHDQLTSFVTNIAPHVEFLTINTYLETTRSIYIKNLKEGQFKRLKSLTMTAMSTQNLLSYVGALSIGFWQTRSTLQILDLNLGASEHTVSLAEILLSCSNVTNVTYTTEASMMALCGDFSLVDNDHPLESLHLSSSSTSADDIDMMLQRCHHLRRLVMNGCDPSVFVPITTHAANLEILGYNPSFNIPELDGSPSPGLRMIYTNNGGAALPASVFMPLVYKHRKTLETFYVSTAALTDSQLRRMYTLYPDFRLENVSRLTFWSHAGIQQFMLPSIRDSATLQHLEAICVHDLSTIARALTQLPPLATFELSHTSGVDTGSNSAGMIELFERYTRLSVSRPTVLNSITLRYCNEITDEVLIALAGVRTMQEVTLGGLNQVSTDAVETFFSRIGAQLKCVKLTDMTTVSDTVMYDLGDCNKLTTVYLNGISNVTIDGLRGLLDTRSHRLDTLTIKRCVSITEEHLRYLKRRVKTLET